MVHLDKLKMARGSLDRCCATPDFFKSFYQAFLRSDPRLPVMFADTDFERQEKLLEHGLRLLLIYAKDSDPAPLKRLAMRHSRQDLDVDPSFYPMFVDSLIVAVGQHDPESTPEVGLAWRGAVAPGIQFMIDRY